MGVLRKEIAPKRAGQAYLGTVYVDKQTTEGMSHTEFHAYSLQETVKAKPDATHVYCVECGEKLKG